MDEVLEITWYVADGYVTGDRPKYFDADIEQLKEVYESGGEEKVREHLLDLAAEELDTNVFPEVAESDIQKAITLVKGE